MPKNRIDHAYLLAMQPDTILSNSRGYDKSARELWESSERLEVKG